MKGGTYVIAEAGVNHNGSLENALALVTAAKEAGADAVKFQTFKAESVASRTAQKAEYQVAATGGGETQYEMLKRLELSPADHLILLARCRELGIQFLSTAFDRDGVRFLDELGLPLMKVPSGELTDLPYLRAVNACRKPVLLSTGMSTCEEIAAALSVLSECQVTLLHCTTEYPCPEDSVNLRAMLSMQNRFGTPVGYSDHTRGIEIPVAAVALGAKVIEKHFTLDRAMPGPDHRASLEPGELKSMISAVRNVERALGNGIKAPAPAEVRNIPVARKSIVAARAIRAGERFSESNLTTKRPGTGTSPMRWDEIVGTVATRDYEEDEQI